MADFMLRFLISNVFLSAAILLLFLIRRMLQHTLTGRMQYRLWYVLMGILAVPFFPIPLTGSWPLFSWMDRLKDMALSPMQTFSGSPAAPGASNTLDAIQDFTLSAGRTTPSAAGNLLFGIWLSGILVMLFLILRLKKRFYQIKRSALPLQSEEVRVLYQSCLDELEITSRIPIYSTAFLKSPVIAGLFRPCIYLPIPLVFHCPARRLRYMLLHELQHYRHKDTLTGLLMDLAAVLYWHHPLVWYALREMRSDRETACDEAVLELLEECDYLDYGRTLLETAETVSPAFFPFAVGISGTMRQMQKRILLISSFQKLSFQKKAKGVFCFCFTAAFLLGFAPLLSTCAADQNIYRWDMSSETVSFIDLSSYFRKYSGSFVLYDSGADAWSVCHPELAVQRTSPNSTYKIYDALFGLEEGIITPQASLMAWDKREYPFAAWNADQDLYSAMQSSVNWYFQRIDEQLGESAIRHYIRKIGYGNQSVAVGGISSYWMQSSLKISPVEQVRLLTDLYQNRFGFAPEHIEAVKQSICLSSSENMSLYGKTGTGNVEGQDISGWFIGFIETDGAPCFFAVHLQSESGATGQKAAEIALSILSDLGLLPPS